MLCSSRVKPRYSLSFRRLCILFLLNFVLHVVETYYILEKKVKHLCCKSTSIAVCLPHSRKRCTLRAASSPTDLSHQFTRILKRQALSKTPGGQLKSIIKLSTTSIAHKSNNNSRLPDTQLDNTNGCVCVLWTEGMLFTAQSIVSGCHGNPKGKATRVLSCHTCILLLHV